jgi:hypothetical protein
MTASCSSSFLKSEEFEIQFFCSVKSAWEQHIPEQEQWLHETRTIMLFQSIKLVKISSHAVCPPSTVFPLFHFEKLHFMDETAFIQNSNDFNPFHVKKFHFIAVFLFRAEKM